MPPSQRTARQERERARHRAEILAAARAVVTERGVSGFTIEEVARTAEFAVGSIYRHFSSKDELLDELVGEMAEPLFAEVEAVAASGAPFLEQLERFAASASASLGEEMPLIRAFLAHPQERPGESAQRLAPLRMRYFGAALSIVRAGQAEGALPEGSSDVYAVALIGLLSAFTKWQAFGVLPPQVDAGAEVVRLFLHGVATPKL